MKSFRLAFWSALLLCTVSTSALAQETEPKKRWTEKVSNYIKGEPWTFDSILPMTHTKYLFRVGKVGILDEYLSPISHTGLGLGVTILTDGKISHRNQKWHYYSEIDLGYGQPNNPANKSTMYTFSGSYFGAPAYRLLQKNNFIIDIAPALSLRTSGHIKLNNTNNIGNVKGTLGLDAWSRVMYRIPSEVVPLNFSYSLQVPLFHVAYHPDYGQSYYDYISGENKLFPQFHAASLHNTLGIRQRLLIDCPLRNVTLTFGIEQNYFKQKINSTRYKYGDVSFLIGISIDHLCLSGNRSTSSKQILSPMYTQK